MTLYSASATALGTIFLCGTGEYNGRRRRKRRRRRGRKMRTRRRRGRRR